MLVNEATLDLIRQFESLHDGDLSQIGLQPKLCPADVWTEGWGRAMRGKDGKFLTRKNTTKAQAFAAATIHTEEQAEQALVEDTCEFARHVDRLVLVTLEPNELGALTSLCYNIGVQAFSTSTALAALNRLDFARCMEAMQWFNKSGGKRLRGLVLRRKKEADLFAQGGRH
jgi:lysozyme